MTKQEQYNHNHTLRTELSNLHKIYDRIYDAREYYEELKEETKNRFAETGTKTVELLDELMKLVGELTENQITYNELNTIK